MLTVFSGNGNGGKFCDGVSRRDFLKIGGLALGGLSLPGILRAEEQAGIKNSHKAIIMVFLAGGPPHQDMFDLKMDAPTGIRGEFKPIKTNVPGIEICEHLPRLARMMDKCTIIRSLVGARNEHNSYISLSGYSQAEFRQQNWPSMGAVLSYLRGPVDHRVPPFVGLQPINNGWGNSGEAGFLGRAHTPVRPINGRAIQDMLLKDISLGRLENRRKLLTTVDRFRKQVAESSEAVAGADNIQQRAFELLSSSKFRDALDVTKEDPKVRERYGYGSPINIDDAAPMWNDQFLVARRLVEAGARCVTLAYGRWDYHNNNFDQCRERLPMLDRALSALIQDLYDRGLDQDVSVLMCGEFGRTPRINRSGGRDHWPQVSQCLIAGGGMRHGQVLGTTEKTGGYADEYPIDYKDVFATLYHQLGFDVENQNLHDGTRPRPLLQGHKPIPELI